MSIKDEVRNLFKLSTSSLQNQGSMWHIRMKHLENSGMKATHFDCQVESDEFGIFQLWSK